MVIYNTAKKHQKLLEQHQNNVSCTGKSSCGRFCVSGDKGEHPHSLVVWSVEEECCLQKIPSPYGSQDGVQGVDQVQMSADARFVYSLGGASTHQTVCVWDWKSAPESPLASIAVRNGRLFSCLSVHPVEPTLFLVTSRTTATFFNYSEDKGELLQHNPGAVDKEFGRSAGHLMQAIFIR